MRRLGRWVSLVAVALSIAINSAVVAWIVMPVVPNLLVRGSLSGTGSFSELFALGPYIAAAVIVIGLPVGLIAHALAPKENPAAQYVSFAVAGLVAGMTVSFIVALTLNQDPVLPGLGSWHFGAVAVLSALCTKRFAEPVRASRVLSTSSIVAAGMFSALPLVVLW